MILLDTSIWIDHLRRGNDAVTEALEAGLVMTHPFVVGELACGNLSNRDEVLTLLGQLTQVRIATHAEVLVFINARSLMGRGVGYIDVHLLASTVLSSGARLWTSDRRLAVLAEELGLALHSP